jgi:hypothetical protein
MFYFAEAFNNGDSDSIKDWVVTKAITIADMFNGSAFNQPINDWTVDDCEDFSGMFANCPFNQPLNDWNMSSARWLHQMFSGNAVFNQDIGSWNFTSITTPFNAFGMFQNAIAFNVGGNPAGLSGWCVPNIASQPNQIFDNTPAFDPKADRIPVWGTCPG